jgi:hypothetical protein
MEVGVIQLLLGRSLPVLTAQNAKHKHKRNVLLIHEHSKVSAISKLG